MKRSLFFYWIVGIAIAAGAIALAFCLDNPVRDFVEAHQSRGLRNVMRIVSLVGNWPGHYYPGLLLAIICWWRGKKNWMRLFAAMVTALCLAGLISRGVNIVAGRSRPSVAVENVWVGPVFKSKYHSFPSGHVAASSAFFGVLYFANRRVGRRFMAIPGLIGISRLYLDAHFLSDVVCGGILGMLCALLTARLFRVQFDIPQSKAET